MKKKLLVVLATLLVNFTFVLNLTAQVSFDGPPGSERFGNEVIVLSNGNFVVMDRLFDDGALVDVGAIYLYNGKTYDLISTLKGSHTNDQIGDMGIRKLKNGNFIVFSSIWNEGRGAITWVDATNGINGTISSANSIVGTTIGDISAFSSFQLFDDGSFFISCENWDNGAAADAGAIIWGNGKSSITGEISSANALIGTKTGDIDMFVASQIKKLKNGNCIIPFPNWDNGDVVDAGAVLFFNGISGATGEISAANALVGTAADDFKGSTVYELTNGHYVVSVPGWDNGSTANAGAVVWCNGNAGRVGTITTSNALYGSVKDDMYSAYVYPLANGNYVVTSKNWDNGLLADVGAVTWCNGSTGTVGAISTLNSLVGEFSGDKVGGSVNTLSNGNYVVLSPDWHLRRGAATWCNGTATTTGLINVGNSLVGANAFDDFGYNADCIELTNGNYIIRNSSWRQGTGAVTWANGTAPTAGEISSSNSLVGTNELDFVGSPYTTALSNGNYVVGSPNWNANTGAVTWGNGTTGTSGEISNSNSLVGSAAGARVGDNIKILPNGNFVVVNLNWNNGSITNAGAVTWVNGTTGITGEINSSNSLIGTYTDDMIGNQVLALSNGNYVVASPKWNSSRGAVTWADGLTGITGEINNTNSMVGELESDNIGSDLLELPNGNYLYLSPNCNNGIVPGVGAITACNASSPISGYIDSSNSMIGSSANENFGQMIAPFPGTDKYIVLSPLWDNGTIADAGAVRIVNGQNELKGTITENNALVGTFPGDMISIYPILLSDNFLLLAHEMWDNGAQVDAGALTWVLNNSSKKSGFVNSCNSIIFGPSLNINNIDIQVNEKFSYLIIVPNDQNRFIIYNVKENDESLAKTNDIATYNIGGTKPIPLITKEGCRVIAAVKAAGANPVNGTVDAKVWIEPSVPTVAGNPFVARHYQIVPANDPENATAKITLYFSVQDFTDFNDHASSLYNLPADASDASGIANLRIAKYAGVSSDDTGLPGSYSNAPTIINPADSDIIWNAALTRWEVSFNTTGFSGFMVQTEASVLALNLLDFTVKKQTADILLNWSTTAESNIEQFMIERSTNGSQFSVIGTVLPNNKYGVNRYQFVDVNAVNHFAADGQVFYRIVVKEISGSKKTVIRKVNLHDDNPVYCYPNPVTAFLDVALPATNQYAVTQLQLADMQGKNVKQWSNKGGGTMRLDLRNLQKGVYILTIRKGSEQLTQKIIKQ